MLYKEYDVSLQISVRWKKAIFANLFMLLPCRGKELGNYFLEFSSYSETVTLIYIFAILFKGTVYNNISILI